MWNLTASEIAYQESHIGDNAKLAIVVPTAVMIAAAYAAVLLRFVSRRLSRTALKADDWSVVTGLVLTTFVVMVYYVSLGNAMGRHFILVRSRKEFILTEVTFASLYILAITFVKLSVLFLYRRLFPPCWFQYALIGTGAGLCIYCTSFIIVGILQCVPIDSFWESNVEGKCIKYGVLSLTGGIINVVTDVVILTLPMPLLWRLNVSKREKWQVILAFLMGGIAIIISIVRSFYLIRVGSHDPTWNDVAPATWSIVECCVGILSACLPLYRPLYTHLYHRNSSRCTSISNNKTTPLPSYVASGGQFQAPAPFYLQGSKVNQCWLDLGSEN
ncbi:MAG: hypothetical protein MMC33_001230 [Icmadophila ericetorum]|nr:hypothetical protein [Icmadophila ericetorum]